VVQTTGIVIGAQSGGPWLKDLLRSLHGCGYPRSIVLTHEWELEAIKQGAELYEEFVFLPQSTIVTDNALWDIVFKDYKGTGVSLSNTPGPFGMYIGKYKSAIVKHIGCPYIPSKEEAIRQEILWCNRYAYQEYYVPLADMPHSEVFEERHGRLNMVTENKWLRRYKGSWGA
jgi:hypothetical protein